MRNFKTHLKTQKTSLFIHKNIGNEGINKRWVWGLALGETAGKPCAPALKGGNVIATSGGSLPCGAKNSQRNLGLLVANEDLTLFASSIAK